MSNLKSLYWARILEADIGFRGRLNITQAGACRITIVLALYGFTRYRAKLRAALDFSARREYVGRAKTAMGTV